MVLIREGKRMFTSAENEKIGQYLRNHINECIKEDYFTKPSALCLQGYLSDD